jgi:hypothetical protein
MDKFQQASEDTKKIMLANTNTDHVPSMAACEGIARVIEAQTKLRNLTEIVICASRKDAITRAAALGVDVTTPSSYPGIPPAVKYTGIGAASSLGWVAYRAAGVRSGELKPNAEEKAALDASEAFCAEAAGTFFLADDTRQVLLVVPLPLAESRDDQLRLHGEAGPAVRWRDEDHYYWHGVAVPGEVIARDTWTADEIEAIKNTEIRRALIERLGGEKVARIMGSEVFDTWTDPKTNLVYELVRSHKAQKTYLRMQSPPLHDGTQPYYLESVPENIESAKAARNWRFGLSEDEDLEYEWEA